MAGEKVFDVLGVKLHAFSLRESADIVLDWIARYRNGVSGPARYICVTNVNSVVEAQKDAYLKTITNNADLSVCDGMPLVWLAKRKGFILPERVYGFALMDLLLSESQKLRLSHYLYGSTPEVLRKLTANIKSKYPRINIAGSYSPPFRELTAQEKDSIITLINSSGADIVWVGLGYPKQEVWMYEFKDKIKCPVLAGVGAAFDFYSGNKKKAPLWMQQAGLEWFFRLLCEPRRLWKRYLVNNSLFIYMLAKNFLRRR